MGEEPWIEWKGGEMPTPPDTIVNVRFRDGVELLEGHSTLLTHNWHHRGDSLDIIAYRVVQP